MCREILLRAKEERGGKEVEINKITFVWVRVITVVRQYKNNILTFLELAAHTLPSVI